MKILVVEPMKPCEVREIPDTLEAMQALVGGYDPSCVSLPGGGGCDLQREGPKPGSAL